MPQKKFAGRRQIAVRIDNAQTSQHFSDALTAKERENNKVRHGKKNHNQPRGIADIII